MTPVESDEKRSSFLKAVLKSAAWFGVGTLLVKFARFVQEIMVARTFGLSDELGIYLAFYAVASVPVNLLLNALQPTLVAALGSERIPDRRIIRTAEGVATAVSVATVVIAVALWIPGSWRVAHAIHLPNTGLAFLLIPYLVFASLNIVWNGELQARGKFFTAGVISIGAPLVTVMALVLDQGRHGVAILALGLGAGTLIESLLYRVLVRRGKRHEQSTRTPGSQALIAETRALVPGSICASLLPPVELAFASLCGAGAMAALGYAQRLPFFFAGMLAMPLGAALVAHFTAAQQRGDRAGLRATMNQYTMLVLACGLPLAFGVWLGSEWIVRLLFERGAFVAADTTLVAPVMSAYLVGLPFYLVRVMQSRFLTAAARNRDATILAAWGLGLTILFNVVMWQLAMGVVGVALATSLAHAAAAFIGWRRVSDCDFATL